MEKKTTKKVGRPTVKPDRAKIGLSVTKEANEMLEYLSNMTGKTKSRIFEEAIKIMKVREDIVYARMEQYAKHGKDSLLDFEELIKNKEAEDINIEEVSDVRAG